MSTSVLVVDDQMLVRAGVVALLNAQDDFDVVGEADDGDNAVTLAERLEPDVVLMDIRMPRMDGVTAARHILAHRPETSILMLTTFDLDEHVFAALRAGASGFLLKDTPPEELVRAVRLVASGEALLAPSVTRRLISEFTSTPSMGRVRPPEFAELTDRETEVVVLVAKGMSNNDIGSELFLAEATVKTHLNRAMTKLKLSSRAQVVAAAYEAGLVAPRPLHDATDQ